MYVLCCAVQDHPLAIGEGQTISAPHMHAICLELLEPHLQPGARVLDVGAGEGAGPLGVWVEGALHYRQQAAEAEVAGQGLVSSSGCALCRGPVPCGVVRQLLSVVPRVFMSQCTRLSQCLVSSSNSSSMVLRELLSVLRRAVQVPVTLPQPWPSWSSPLAVCWVWRRCQSWWSMQRGALQDVSTQLPRPCTRLCVLTLLGCFTCILRPLIHHCLCSRQSR